jgi:hypothetical protein
VWTRDRAGAADPSEGERGSLETQGASADGFLRVE